MGINDLARQIYKKKKKDAPPVCKTCHRLSNAGEIRMERDDFQRLTLLATRGFTAISAGAITTDRETLETSLARADLIASEHLALRTARRLLVEFDRDRTCGVDRSKL